MRGLIIPGKAALIILTCPLLNATQTERTAALPSSPRPAALEVSVPTVFLTGSILVALGAQDKKIQEHVPMFRESRLSQKLNLSALGNKRTFFDLVGGPMGSFGLAGTFYIWGAAADSPKAKTTSSLVARAFVLNSVLVLGVKGVVGRTRPVSLNRLDPNQFKPLSGEASFPSGHTSAAFAAASVIAEEYPSWWAQGLSYGTASLVGIGRFLQNKHWASDVAAGALLGYGAGKMVSRGRQKAWRLEFASTGYGLALSRRF